MLETHASSHTTWKRHKTDSPASTSRRGIASSAQSVRCYILSMDDLSTILSLNKSILSLQPASSDKCRWWEILRSVVSAVDYWECNKWEIINLPQTSRMATIRNNSNHRTIHHNPRPRMTAISTLLSPLGTTPRHLPPNTNLAYPRRSGITSTNPTYHVLHQ